MSPPPPMPSRANKPILTISEKKAKTILILVMSSRQSLRAPEYIAPALTQSSQGSDSNYARSDNRTERTGRRSSVSSPSVASNSLAKGATSASGGTQDDLQEGEPSSPNMFDLLKSQCPKYFEGRADIKLHGAHWRINCESTS
jgi:hypothetical protein